jgi:hypothetical protein
MYGNREPLGYNVTNTVSVVVRNLDLVGDVIGTGVAAGANMSHGIHFSLENPHALYLDALAIAVQDAAAKGRVIATALNTSVANVVSVYETSSWWAPVARADFDMAPMMEMAAAGDAGWGVPIQSGDLTVTARVEVVYALR